jgi:hypothetical protein
MNTIRRITITKFTFLWMTTVSIVALALITQVGLSTALAWQYNATATMCYIDTFALDVDEKKNKTIETGAVYVWRIQSDDDELMNGWEYTHDTIIIHEKGMGDKTSGYLEMYPDAYYPSGWFVEDKYSFKSQMESPEGIYTGVGTLDGVTATYKTEFLLPIQEPPIEECMYGGDLPPLCDDNGELYPWCMPLPLKVQLSVTGTIED